MTTMRQMTADMEYAKDNHVVNLTYSPRTWIHLAQDYAELPLFMAFGRVVTLTDLHKDGYALHIHQKRPRNSLRVTFKHKHGLCVTFKGKLPGTSADGMGTPIEVITELATPYLTTWTCSIGQYAAEWPTMTLPSPSSDITTALQDFNRLKAEELSSSPRPIAGEIVKLREIA